MLWNKQKKMNPNKDPRAHHYVFAHVALRTFCERDPLKFFAIMASEQKEDFISFVWEKVCEQCDENEKADFSEKDIKISTIKVRNYPTVIIVMPEATAIAEAIMIGVVLTTKTENINADTKIEYRYFVLEQGVDIKGGSRTVFCEWSNKGHLNMGDGPEATVDSFIETIKQKI